MKYNFETKSTHKIQKIKDLMYNELKNKYYKNGNAKDFVIVNEETIKTNSKKLFFFFEKGCKCEVCGAKGDFFSLERNVNKTNYFLNLYTIDKNTKEIFLMLKELRVPVKFGGKDTLENSLIVCDKCYLDNIREQKRRIKQNEKEICCDRKS